MGQAQSETEQMADFLRRLWTKLTLHGVHYSGSKHRLDALYALNDPWNMSTEREQHRFRAVSDVISTCFQPIDSILEVGCGEGHQSQWLEPLCNRLLGVDVSSRAIARATTRCPNSTFVVEDIFNNSSQVVQTHFDLVVACEILYYLRDPDAAIRTISQLGTHKLITYYDRHSDVFDTAFSRIPQHNRASSRFGDTVWHIVWWSTSAL